MLNCVILLSNESPLITRHFRLSGNHLIWYLSDCWETNTKDWYVQQKLCMHRPYKYDIRKLQKLLVNNFDFSRIRVFVVYLNATEEQFNSKRGIFFLYCLLHLTVLKTRINRAVMWIFNENTSYVYVFILL